jgi:hypothetical protein
MDKLSPSLGTDLPLLLRMSEAPTAAVRVKANGLSLGHEKCSILLYYFSTFNCKPILSLVTDVLVVGMS